MGVRRASGSGVSFGKRPTPAICEMTGLCSPPPGSRPPKPPPYPCMLGTRHFATWDNCASERDMEAVFGPIPAGPGMEGLQNRRWAGVEIGGLSAGRAKRTPFARRSPAVSRVGVCPPAAPSGLRRPQGKPSTCVFARLRFSQVDGMLCRRRPRIRLRCPCHISARVEDDSTRPAAKPHFPQLQSCAAH